MAKASNTTSGTAPGRPVAVSPTPATKPARAAEPKPASTPAAPAPRPAARPTHEQLSRRAYEIYLERCQAGKPGTPHGDWAQAEAELTR